MQRGITAKYGLLDWQGSKKLLSWDHPIPDTGIRYLWDNFTWQDLRDIYYKGKILTEAPANIAGVGLSGDYLVVACWSYDAGQKKVTFIFYQTEFLEEYPTPPVWLNMGSHTTDDVNQIRIDLAMPFSIVMAAPTQGCYFSRDGTQATCVVIFENISTWTAGCRIDFKFTSLVLTEVNQYYIVDKDGESTNRFSIEARYYINDYNCEYNGYIKTIGENYITLASDFSANELSLLEMSYAQNKEYGFYRSPYTFPFMKETIGLSLRLNGNVFYDGHYNLRNPLNNITGGFSKEFSNLTIYSMDLRDKSIFYEIDKIIETYFETYVWWAVVPEHFPDTPGEKTQKTELKLRLNGVETIIKTNNVFIEPLSITMGSRNSIFSTFKLYLIIRFTAWGLKPPAAFVPPPTSCEPVNIPFRNYDNRYSVRVYPGGDYANYSLSNIGSLLNSNTTFEYFNVYQSAMLSKKLRFVSFPYDVSTINVLTDSDPVALNQSTGNNPRFYEIGVLSL